MEYKTYLFNELKAKTEKYTETLYRESESGVLLFIKSGARLLGMYPKRAAENVLWVNQHLETLMAQNLSMIGGDRLWISPQRTFFYENPRDFEGYFVPSEIDPGNYSIVEKDNDIIFENVFSLLSFDTNRLFDNSLERRQFRTISDPYNSNLSFIGVAITDTIEVKDVNIKMNSCSHTRVFTGGSQKPGTALFPLQNKTVFINYFGSIPQNRREVFDTYGRVKIDAHGCFKIAIRPEDCVSSNPCKIVYVSPTQLDSSFWLCVIKRSENLPTDQGECLDISKYDPFGLKGAIQLGDSGSGGKEMERYPYGELQFHFPKGVVVGNKTISSAEHELLSYYGKKNDILELAKTALNTKCFPNIY